MPQIVVVITIQHALRELACVTSVKTGLLENFVSIAGKSISLNKINIWMASFCVLVYMFLF